jgi:ABC-type multidrug transport system ATPase subunit
VSDDKAEVVIRTRGLTKLYGDLVAVDHLDLDVRAGEIFGLLGPNGAGKTTTILMLLGLSEPTDGRARVLGLDPARDPLAIKLQVGYLPDAVGFYGGMTGRENLRYTTRLNGLSRAEADRRIDEAIGLVGLADRADDATNQYSRGMKQRLGIADALVRSLVSSSSTSRLPRSTRSAWSRSSTSSGPWPTKRASRSSCRRTCSTRSSRSAIGSGSSARAT